MGPSVHLEKWVCLLDLHTINHDQHYKGTARKKAGGDGSCSAQMLLSQLLAARERVRFKQRLYHMDGHCLQVWKVEPV